MKMKPDKHYGHKSIYIGVCCNQRHQLGGFISVCDTPERFYGIENGSRASSEIIVSLKRFKF